MRAAVIQIQPPTHTKLPRDVAAWRWEPDPRTGVGDIPAYVLGHITYIPRKNHWSITSPASGHANVFGIGDWIIQADTGCFYTIPDAAFRQKYAPK